MKNQGKTQTAEYHQWLVIHAQFHLARRWKTRGTVLRNVTEEIRSYRLARQQSKLPRSGVRKNSRNYTLRPGDSIRSSQVFQFNLLANRINLCRL